jgi:hypothetical protein
MIVYSRLFGKNPPYFFFFSINFLILDVREGLMIALVEFTTALFGFPFYFFKLLEFKSFFDC